MSRPISPSPTPIDFSTMSTRRIPLSTNQNAANSPLRSTALKQKRTMAQLQREEPYGQPPPAKKLIVDVATQRVVKSPSQQRAPKSQIPVQSRRPTTNTCDTKLAREKAAARHQQETAAAAAEYPEKDIEEILVWKGHHKARFPKSLFYFDQIPSDVAHKLKRHIAALGGHETAFFSVDVTHVITSRPIPTEAATTTTARDNGHSTASEKEATQPEQEQAATINPSLLTRFPNASIKSRLFDTDLRSRAHRTPPQPAEQSLRAPKKAQDVLIRAREMKKKIWTADKLYRMTTLLLETDPYRCADMAYGRLKTTLATQIDSRGVEDRNLLKLLQKERVNGPSDRDPTVVASELVHFKGPYIYVYDIEEKQKPIMMKEYPKPTDTTKGEWPQFQTAALGRCPFIENSDVREAREARKAKMEQQKARARADNQETMTETNPAVQPTRMAPPRPVTGKRTLSEMELAHDRQSSLSRSFGGENMDFSRKAFTSRAATGRLLAGEPVASGVQPSNVTSAIRSQMISSTATTPGVITGLSKEVHSLQRQVLRWHTQDHSSRHTPETSFREDSSIKRPPTLGRTSSRKLELIEEKGKEKGGSRSTERAPRKKAHDRELKPGYCENCVAKYSDFEEHIESRDHRNFADDDENWVELDDLLAQLERIPKRHVWKSTPSWSHA
ncbi:hypothetical protein F4802DRAFT_604986 [Xylaria palmicola]|nr:hypothetical protein F4802DRAFT_604986 [Xylaria palmicola]